MENKLLMCVILARKSYKMKQEYAEEVCISIYVVGSFRLCSKLLKLILIIVHIHIL